MATSRSSIARLLLEARPADQAGFGAVDVALALEHLRVRRPFCDCASAGNVLVLGARRNIREPLPSRRSKEDDGDGKRAGAPLNDAAGSAEGERRNLRVGRARADEFDVSDAGGQARE